MTPEELEQRDRAKHRRTLVRQAETGGVAVEKALAALQALDPANFPPYMIPALMEKGAAVQLTALGALRELDIEERRVEDPWQRIADELTAHPDSWPDTAR
jgi:hypothetical protein